MSQGMLKTMALPIATYSSAFPPTNSHITELEWSKLILPNKLFFHKASGFRKTRFKHSHWNPIHWSNIGFRIGGLIGQRSQEHRDGKVKVLGRVYNEGKSWSKNPIAADLDEYARLLKEYTKLKSLERGRKVHQLILDSGIDVSVYLGNLLISMYAKCGSIEDARQVFDKMPLRDVISWNSIIAGYVQNGYEREALKIFEEMRHKVRQTTKLTFASVLRACTVLEEIEQGKQVHGLILKMDLASDATVKNKLIKMYAKCGSMDDAYSIFIYENTNGFSWTPLIMGYVQNGQHEEALKLLCRMQQAGVAPESFTYVTTLSSCANLEDVEHGEQLHALVIKSGYELNLVVANALITMYANCQNVEHARKVFDIMPERDVISWSAMIAGYGQNECGNEALKLIHGMQSAFMKLDFTLNEFTLASVVSVCGNMSILQRGMELHAHIIKTGFGRSVYVGTALVDMYSKCGSIEAAYKFLNEMQVLDLVPWNAMIAGYVQNGRAEEALKFLSQMELQGMKPNMFTLASILKACASMKALRHGEEIHARVIKTGVESDIFVGSSLVDMYVKSENVESAARVFHSMSEQNIVSWNSIIAGYVQNRHGEKALRLFCEMQQACLMPDNFILASILGACTDLSALGNGQQIHALIIKTGFNSDEWVGSALVDMYAKCGFLENARTVFDEIVDPDVVALTVMIAAYAQHGNGKEALQLFEQLKNTGMTPDHITFTSVLSACGQEGLVSKGREYFHSMSQSYRLTPRMDHYACMVELLGRSKSLDEAESFIKEMPIEPSSAVWWRLLVACRYHGDMERGKLVAEKILKMEPENPLTYVLLSNVLTTAGRLQDAAEVLKMMKERGLEMEPGKSWIELKSKVHIFSARDRSHPQIEKIYTTLEELTKKMKEAGYVTGTKFVLYELEDEKNEQCHCYHSEKLAVAFGLITIPPGVPIRFVKNFYICDDCHRTMEYISEVVGREIILRDLNGFHHFKHGRCSCGSYW